MKKGILFSLALIVFLFGLFLATQPASAATTEQQILPTVEGCGLEVCIIEVDPPTDVPATEEPPDCQNPKTHCIGGGGVTVVPPIATNTSLPPTETATPLPPIPTETATLLPPTATETPLPPTETATSLPPTVTRPGGGIVLTEPPVETTANPTADSTATSLPPTPTGTPVAPLPTDKPYPTERPTKLPTATRYPMYPTLRQAQGNAWTMTTQPTVTMTAQPTSTLAAAVGENSTGARKKPTKPVANNSKPTVQAAAVVILPTSAPVPTPVSGPRIPASPTGAFALSAFALGFCFVALSARRPRALRRFARTLRKMKFPDD